MTPLSNAFLHTKITPLILQRSLKRTILFICSPSMTDSQNHLSVVFWQGVDVPEGHRSKTHIMANRKQTRRDAPDDCFGEPNSFWLSVHPKDYLRIINQTKYDSPEAKFMRKAVEKRIGKLGGKSSRNLAQWKEGWGAVPLLSPLTKPLSRF